MFTGFESNFQRDQMGRRTFGGAPTPPTNAARLGEYFDAYGGASFGDGLYRVIHPADVARWRERVAIAFPEFGERIFCFVYDWAGTVLALDHLRQESGQPGVLLFEPGTGEALQVPANLQTFHEIQLTNNGEAALALSFYKKWRASGGSSPTYDQCVGYKRPLFLGGIDKVENLELSDLDVYWTLAGQLIAKVRGLPPGTPVRIELDD